MEKAPEYRGIAEKFRREAMQAPRGYRRSHLSGRSWRVVAVALLLLTPLLLAAWLWWSPVGEQALY